MVRIAWRGAPGHHPGLSIQRCPLTEAASLGHRFGLDQHCGGLAWKVKVQGEMRNPTLVQLLTASLGEEQSVAQLLDQLARPILSVARMPAAVE